RVGIQVAAADIAVVLLAKAVDDGGISLQAHAYLQPAREDPGNLRAFFGDAGFLFDDGRENERFVRSLQRQRRITLRPKPVKRLLHRRVRALKDHEIAFTLDPGVGFREKPALGLAVAESELNGNAALAHA